MIDEELLNLLEPKEYEVEYAKILKRGYFLSSYSPGRKMFKTVNGRK